MRILDHKKIRQKIDRLSFEILENHYQESSIYLAGINNNGHDFAKKLKTTLQKNSEVTVNLIRISLNPANPLDEEIQLSVDPDELKNKVVIIIDDVANTGRTIFYAIKPLLDILTKKVEVCVLIDRTHKSFPIKVDYVGLSLATTMKENIRVELKGGSDAAVYLE